MSYEYLPTNTIDEVDNRTVWVRNSGREKGIMSVMLLADSHDTKCAPFVVFKQPPSRNPNNEQFNRSNQHDFGRYLWDEIQDLQYKTSA